MSDLLAGLSRDIRLTIVQEALRLLAALPDGKPKAIAEKLRQIFLPERGKIGSTKLRIGTYPVGYMLHGRPALFLPRGEERDWLRGWALVGALRFCHDFGESDRFSRVAAGLRAARRPPHVGWRLYP